MSRWPGTVVLAARIGASAAGQGMVWLVTYPAADTQDLVGQGVRLELLTEAHVPALVRAANVDRSSYTFTRVPEDEPSMSTFVSALTKERAEGTCVPFAIVSTQDGLVVGTTRFLDLQFWPLPGDTNARPFPSVAEIGGTWLTAPSQGNGTNREVKLLMLDHAFDVWGAWRIRFQTDARNKRSRTALESLGARHEGVQRAHKLASDGTVRDTAWYSILRSEWPAARWRMTQRTRQQDP